jgi:hypothetical protein
MLREHRLAHSLDERKGLRWNRRDVVSLLRAGVSTLPEDPDRPLEGRVDKQVRAHLENEGERHRRPRLESADADCYGFHGPGRLRGFAFRAAALPLFLSDSDRRLRLELVGVEARESRCTSTDLRSDGDAGDALGSELELSRDPRDTMILNGLTDTGLEIGNRVTHLR